MVAFVLLLRGCSSGGGFTTRSFGKVALQPVKMIPYPGRVVGDACVVPSPRCPTTSRVLRQNQSRPHPPVRAILARKQNVLFFLYRCFHLRMVLAELRTSSSIIVLRYFLLMIQEIQLVVSKEDWGNQTGHNSVTLPSHKQETEYPILEHRLSIVKKHLTIRQ